MARKNYDVSGILGMINAGVSEIEESIRDFPVTVTIPNEAIFIKIVKALNHTVELKKELDDAAMMMREKAF